MGSYRKKPVVVEAWHFTYDQDREPAPTWLDDAARQQFGQPGSVLFEPDHPDGPRFTIATLEGLMVAVPGDWIIKGIQGELYPCKPDIFEATYELVPHEHDWEKIGQMYQCRICKEPGYGVPA